MLQTARLGASCLINSFLFRPLKSTYDFNYTAAVPGEHRVIYIPVLLPSWPQRSAPYLVPCLHVRGANPPSEKTLFVCHFHGTSGDAVKSGVYLHMRNRLPFADALVVEFPGYGTASPLCPDGETPLFPTYDSVLEVGKQVLSYVANTMKVPRECIVISGRSMGTGIAAALAADALTTTSSGLAPPKALVLLSPYRSIAEVAAGVVVSKVCGASTTVPERRGLFVCSIAALATALLEGVARFGQTTLCETLASIDAISSSSSSVFVSHGANDTLIPVAHSNTIVQSLHPVLAVQHVDPKGGHSDLHYKDQLAQFLAQLHQQQQQQQQHSSRGVSLADALDDKALDEFVASPAAVSALSKQLPCDQATAKKIKSTAIRAFLGLVLVTVLASSACAAFGAKKLWDWWFTGAAVVGE